MLRGRRSDHKIKWQKTVTGSPVSQTPAPDASRDKLRLGFFTEAALLMQFMPLHFPVLARRDEAATSVKIRVI